MIHHTKIINLVDHILDRKNQQQIWLNQTQVNQMTLMTLKWLKKNQTTPLNQLFDDYNSIKYRFKNPDHLIPSLNDKYKYYVAQPILDGYCPNLRLSQINRLNQFIDQL